jgi:putative membrane protein insertion efficiency factor
MPEPRSLPARLRRLPAQALLGLIWLYQRTLSPALPTIFGAACGCRFAPTCSHYAAEALRTHGCFTGCFLALRRLMKCTPLHPGGFDPVPARSRFSCVNVTKATPAQG